MVYSISQFRQLQRNALRCHLSLDVPTAADCSFSAIKLLGETGPTEGFGWKKCGTGRQREKENSEEEKEKLSMETEKLVTQLNCTNCTDLPSISLDGGQTFDYRPEANVKD